MLSDSFPMEEVDGVMLKVKSSIITKGALSVNTGANAAAEATEDDETVDDPTVGAPPQFLSLHLARVAQRCCSHTAGPRSTRGDTFARLDPDLRTRAPADVQAEKVNDVVDAFNLQSMGGFDKAAALSWVSSLSSPPRRPPVQCASPGPALSHATTAAPSPAMSGATGTCTLPLHAAAHAAAFQRERAERGGAGFR